MVIINIYKTRLSLVILYEPSLPNTIISKQIKLIFILNFNTSNKAKLSNTYQNIDKPNPNRKNLQHPPNEFLH